jgi:hypothetical protein
MSLMSTIAHDRAPQARGFSFKGIGLMVAGVVLGAAVGIAIVNVPTATEAPAASTTGMALDDFIRLNTTSYEGIASAAAVEPQAVSQAFLDMNIASYEGYASAVAGTQAAVEPSVLLRSPATADRDLWYLNVTSFGYPTRPNSEQPGGLR